jgi:hypothetical protein
MLQDVSPQTRSDLENRFAYHAPNDDRRERHEILRKKLGMLAQEICSLVPSGRELSTALSRLEEVMFWGNAGIAREQDKADRGLRNYTKPTGGPAAHE